MAYCPNCGLAQAEEAKFCTSCGTLIPQATSGAQAISQTPTDQPSAPAPVPAKKFPVKLVAIIGGAVLVLILMIVLIAVIFGGGSKTASLEKYYALQCKEKTTPDEAIDAVTNGYLASEFKSLIKIASGMDGNESLYEDFADSHEDSYEHLVETYGDHLTISFEYEDEDKIGKDDLKSKEDSFRSKGKEFRDYAKAYNKLDDDEKEDLADEFGLSKGDLDQAMKLVGTIGEKMKNCKVEEGCEIEVTATIKGSEDDDEDDDTMDFYKIDGIWINRDLFNMALSMVNRYYSSLFYSID